MMPKLKSTLLSAAITTVPFATTPVRAQTAGTEMSPVTDPATKATNSATSGVAPQGTAPATSSEPVARAQEGGITDIIVTAQRRSESIQNVPITITAIGGDALTDSNVKSLQDLTTLVSGFVGPGDIGFQAPHLRGVGSQVSSPGLESAVALYVDGVYIGATSPALLRLTNVAQLEVLKGPQGTLFGRNTTGGLIQITTRNPGRETEIAAEIGYANYETYTGSAYLNMTIGENVFTNLAVQASGAGDGWGTNLATGRATYQLKSEIAVRNKWDVTLGDHTTLFLMGDYEQHNDLNYFAHRSLVGTRVTAGYTSTVDGYDVNSASDVRIRSRAWGLTGRLTQDFGFATLTDTIAYRDTEFDILDFTGNYAPSPFDDIHFFFNTKNHQLTNELQLSSNNTGAFKWTAGFFYYHATDLIDLPTVSGPVGPPFGTVLDLKNKTRSLAGYGQASYEVAPGTTLTGGLRYSRDRHAVSGSYMVTPPFAFLSETSTQPAFSQGAVSARASIAQKINPNVLVYASYNRGTKSGGFSPVRINNAPFEDEKIDAYEIGGKFDLLDRKLRLNVAGFHYDYTNLQVQSFKNAGPPVTYNAGSAKLTGVDVDLEIRPTPNLTLTGSFSYVDAKFGDFPTAEFYAPCTLAQVPTGQCSPANAAAGAAFYVFNANAKGNALPLAPKYTASAAINYKVPTDFGRFDLGVTESYNGGFATTAGNELRQGAFQRLGATIQFTTPDERYYVRLFGSNLTSTKDASLLNLLQSGPITGLNSPRTYGITLGAKIM